MKLPLMFALVCMGLFLKFCTSSKEVASNENDSPVSAPSSNSVVSPLLHGFNVENLYFHFKGQQQGKELIAGVSPKVFRFPGGTPANIYHIDQPGYGYNASDTERMKPGSPMLKNMEKCLRLNSKALKNKNISQNYAHDFAKIVKANGAKVLLVANLLSDDENILAMIRFFDNEGIGIAGVELGNEYYFSAYQDIFPDVESYIVRAKQAEKAIHAEFKDLPIAVVAANSSALRESGIRHKMHSEAWNEALAKEDFFDAYISHIYSLERSCDAQGNDRFNCYADHNSTFAAIDVPAAMKAMSELFGGRPVWITEWNVKDVSKGLGDTFMQAIYYADFSLAIAQIEEVQIATYHNLMTGGKGYNMIGKGGGTPDKPFVERTAYPVVQLFASVYDGKHRTKEVPSMGTDIKKLSMGAFESESETVYFVVNKSSGALSLSGLQLADKITLGKSSVNSVNGENMASSKWSRVSSDLATENDLSEFRFAPYSVNKLVIKK